MAATPPLQQALFLLSQVEVLSSQAAADPLIRAAKQHTRLEAAGNYALVAIAESVAQMLALYREELGLEPQAPTVAEAEAETDAAPRADRSPRRGAVSDELYADARTGLTITGYAGPEPPEDTVDGHTGSIRYQITRVRRPSGYLAEEWIITLSSAEWRALIRGVSHLTGRPPS